jgi:hypothetical protein
MTLIAAVTDKEVVGLQLIEGGTDAALIEQFVFHMLLQMRKKPEYESKHLVLYMDNAIIHKHELVL